MSALDKIDAGGYKWKGYKMVAVKTDDHRQIHLLAPSAGMFQRDTTICGLTDNFVDRNVATGWPDCNKCKDEVFRRMVAA